jgi:hypothetical protein
MPVGERSVLVSETLPNFTTELAAKFEPFSVIVNGPAGILVGEILQSCGGGTVMVMITAPNFVELAVLVARTLTALLAGTIAGALYRPAVETVPFVESPPVTPFTDQVTVFGVRGTYAVSCLVCPMGTLPLLYTVICCPRADEAMNAAIAKNCSANLG